MLRSVAISRIKQGLGFRTDLDDEAALMLQEAQRFYEKGKTLPWFLIEEGDTLVTVADTREVALPDGFIREVDRRPVYFTDSDDNIVQLKKKDYQTAWEAYKDADSAAPEVYALTSTEAHFFPLPDDAYTVSFTYYKAAAILDSDVENVWLENVPELLIGEAGYRLAMDLYDVTAAQKFDSMRKQAWDSVLRETIARDEAARDISMGSDL